MPIVRLSRRGGRGRAAQAAYHAAAHGSRHTIIFEDHGQDFLEWEITDGVVTDCRPFQSGVWKGTHVDMTKAAEGQRLPIITASGTKLILYPIAAMSRTA
jgi:hypothetical protein